MTITLDDLQGNRFYLILSKYEGKNPYIYNLRKTYEKNKKTKFTKNQIDYVLNITIKILLN